MILDIEDVRQKPRKVFMFLSETGGEGSQSALARELRIGPAGVTQCKLEVGQALARHGCHGPPGPRPGAGQATATARRQGTWNTIRCTPPPRRLIRSLRARRR